MNKLIREIPEPDIERAKRIAKSRGPAKTDRNEAGQWLPGSHPASVNSVLVEAISEGLGVIEKREVNGWPRATRIG